MSMFDLVGVKFHSHFQFGMHQICTVAVLMVLMLVHLYAAYTAKCRSSIAIHSIGRVNRSRAQTLHTRSTLLRLRTGLLIVDWKGTQAAQQKQVIYAHGDTAARTGLRRSGFLSENRSEHVTHQT
jgi:hypothetical protein